METSVSEESDSASSAEENHSKTVCKTLIETTSLQSDSEFDQELCKKDIEKLLNTNPDVFKHCNLKWKDMIGRMPGLSTSLHSASKSVEEKCGQVFS